MSRLTLSTVCVFLHFLRKRFEVEKLGKILFLTSHRLSLKLPIAPDEVEMEDLNFYYANYSR